MERKCTPFGSLMQRDIENGRKYQSHVFISTTAPPPPPTPPLRTRHMAPTHFKALSFIPKGRRHAAPRHLSTPHLWNIPCQQSLSPVTWLWINSAKSDVSFSCTIWGGEKNSFSCIFRENKNYRAACRLRMTKMTLIMWISLDGSFRRSARPWQLVCQCEFEMRRFECLEAVFIKL